MRRFYPLLLVFILRAHAADALPENIRFLSKDEAAKAIAEDKPEPYFPRLQALEMIAKTGSPLTAAGLPAQRTECCKRYQAAMDDFTDDEKSALAAVADSIRSKIKSDYPLYANTPWSFIKTDGSIEGGMPHTRGAHIVLSAQVAAAFALLAPKAKAANRDPAASRLGMLLAHEQSHVVQRARPELFADLYTKVWGFTRAKNLPTCAYLDKLQVVNPDGPDVGWVYSVTEDGKQNYYQPIVIFKDALLNDDAAAPKMPRDFRTFAIALDKKDDTYSLRLDAAGKPEMTPLDDIAPYADAFAATGEDFHPNEIFAVLFSWLVMHDSYDNKRESGHFEKLRDWCKKNFAVPNAK
ncbi:MAG TPA: hypothetical protein VKX17_26505 [Planctomycetota bacterium]|nr:hypothetical protein [Planctomycetota bacterium]